MSDIHKTFAASEAARMRYIAEKRFSELAALRAEVKRLEKLHEWLGERHVLLGEEMDKKCAVIAEHEKTIKALWSELDQHRKVKP